VYRPPPIQSVGGPIPHPSNIVVVVMGDTPAGTFVVNLLIMFLVVSQSDKIYLRKYQAGSLKMRSIDYSLRFGRRRHFFIGSFLTVALGVSCVICAADGDLDPSWHSDGVATLGVTETRYAGNAIALQCDGKVVVAGIANGAGESAELAVVRYNTDGSLDTSFATNGLFAIDVGDIGSSGWGVAVQADGKIVVVGGTVVIFGGTQFLVMRLTSGGVLDTTFAGDGIEIFNFGSSSWARSVAIQGDGRVVVVGTSTNLSAIAVARFTTNGHFDSSFDDDGKTLVDFEQGDDEGWGVAVQEDGRILVVGTASVGAGSVAVVIRFLVDGTLDTSFGVGGGGAAAVDFGIYSDGRGIAVQEDGKIVVVGITDDATSVAVARLTSGGLLDTTFSGDGMVTHDFGEGFDEGWDVALQGDGRIVVTGSGYTSGSHKLAVLRFLADGSLDPSLGGSGSLLVSLGTDFVGRAVAVQPNDRKLLVAGTVSTSVNESQLAVVRLIGDSNLIFAAGFECGDTTAWSSTNP
jgi:uncharacterized delta-60 repeat protein